jgi:hypothetical protein
MMTEIGIVAGEIWHYLDSRGEAVISRLARDINRPKDLVLMSAGWLAREGHVVLNAKDKDYSIILRK